MSNLAIITFQSVSNRSRLTQRLFEAEDALENAREKFSIAERYEVMSRENLDSCKLALEARARTYTHIKESGELINLWANVRSMLSLQSFWEENRRVLDAAIVKKSVAMAELCFINQVIDGL